MNTHQQGYTLIELMISLLLGLMMISGFGSLFVQTQKSSTIQRSLSYMMEDGRYILEIFGRELRRTGFLKNKIINGGDANSVFIRYPFDSPAAAPEAPDTDPAALGSTMSFLKGEYIKGGVNPAGFGDHLMLRYQLNNDIDPSTGKSYELASDGLSSTNSACERSILLTSAEDTAPTQKHVVTLYFYIALDSTSVPVLYCKAKRRNFNDPTTNSNPTPSAEPLISNVQQLLITYGIDSDADSAADYYTSAGSVTNWQQVVAAKLSVVLRSDDNNLTQSSVSYAVDGTSYTATDKRLYRTFSTTVAFRN